MAQTATVYLHPTHDKENNKMSYHFWRSQTSRNFIMDRLCTFSFVYHLSSMDFFYAALSATPVLINMYNERMVRWYKKTSVSKIDLIRLVHEGGFKKEPHVGLIRITDRNENEIDLQSFQVRPMKNKEILQTSGCRQIIERGDYLVWVGGFLFEI